MTRKHTTGKYFMLTRGRTGSTAILDELGTVPGVVSAQEYFLVWSWPDGRLSAETLRDMYGSALPFEAWKARLEKDIAAIDAASPGDQERLVSSRMRSLLQTLIGRAPARVARYAQGFLDRKLYEPYLRYVETTTLKDGTGQLIFKLLSNNVMERPGLVQILKRHGYRALHLVRKNLVRQVLSNLVAQKRGVYNQKNYKGDGASYHIDVDELERWVNREKRAFEEDRALLRKMAFDTLEVSYEDFCDDRRRFYARTLEFMGLPPKLPGRTDYSIITDNLRSVVANYEEVEARVARMGLGGSLIENRHRTSG